MLDSRTILTLGGIGLYVAASVPALLGLVRPSQRGTRWMVMLLTAGALSLLLVLGLRGMAEGHVRALSRFEAFTAYALVITFAFLVIRHRRGRLDGIAAIVVPYVTVVLILGLPALHTRMVLAPPIQNIWLVVHIATAFLAYACFSLAGIMAILYLVQDRNLKRGHSGVLLRRLPPLETLDRLMSVQVAIAFLMLTVAILLGILLVRLSGGGEEWLTDPKVVATVVTWCLFALLVHMRSGANRHGRRVAFVIIMGLVCLAYAFVGVPTVANSLHSFLKVGG